MKAISLTQPWATLVAIGMKCVETRSWRSWYFGEIAIHAAKSYPRWAQNFCDEKVVPYFTNQTLPKFPTGCIVAKARLIACVGTNNCGMAAKALNFVPDHPWKQEWMFGDFSAGRWAWLLCDVVPIDPPIPARGALGIWEWAQE